MEKQKRICPSCDGKGHVLSGVMMLNLFVLAVSVFETNSKNGMSRRECDQCDGLGYVEW